MIVHDEIIRKKHWFEDGYRPENVLHIKKIDDERRGLFDTDGKRLGNIDFYAIQSRFFVSGLLAVQIEKDGQWGFIDTNGALVIPPKFEDDKLFRQFHCDRLVLKDGRVFDKTGIELFDLSKKYFAWDDNYVNGRLAVQSDKIGKDEIDDCTVFGYIDIDGNEVIPCQFPYWANPFIRHRAAANWCDWRKVRGKAGKTASKNARMGILDDKGNWIVQPQYKSIFFLFGEPDYYNGKYEIKNSADMMFIVNEMGRNGKSGIMNGNGEWVVKPMFKPYSIEYDQTGERFAQQGIAVKERNKIREYTIRDKGRMNLSQRYVEK